MSMLWTTVYVLRPHAPDGAPTVGVARIRRGAVLERRARPEASRIHCEPNRLIAFLGVLGFFGAA